MSSSRELKTSLIAIMLVLHDEAIFNRRECIDISKLFSKTLIGKDNVLKIIDELVDLGFVKVEGNRVCITKTGIEVMEKIRWHKKLS